MPPPPRTFGQFIGVFDVQAVFRQSSTASDTTRAGATFTFDLGGCVVRETYEGRRFGEPYAYVALWGTGGAADAPIQRSFVHSQHGFMAIYSGGWNSSGDTLVVSDSALVGGLWIRERERLTRRPDGVVDREADRSEDGGVTWITTQRLRYTPRR